MYFRFMLDDMESSSDSFQVALCGCQEPLSFQDNKLLLHTKKSHHCVHSCCIIQIVCDRAPKAFGVDQNCNMVEVLLVLTPEMWVFVWLVLNKAKNDGNQRLKTLDQRFIPETSEFPGCWLSLWVEILCYLPEQ